MSAQHWFVYTWDAQLLKWRPSLFSAVSRAGYFDINAAHYHMNLAAKYFGYRYPYIVIDGDTDPTKVPPP